MRIKYNQECPIVFITNVTFQRRKLFSRLENAELLIRLLHEGQSRYDYRIYAFCIMPDHYHALLEFGGRCDLSVMLHRIHSYFAHSVQSQSPKARVWSRRAWDVWIRSEWMYWQKVAYILLNPWRAGLVRNPLDPYPYSSIQAYRTKHGDEFLYDLFGTYARRGEGGHGPG